MTRRRPTLPARRLRLEPLEDRALMAVLYVSAASGNDGGSGAINSPFQSIQKAVNAASSGDFILVGAGTYNYVAAQDQFFATLGQNAVVTVLNKSLTIQGGYSTANWGAGPNPQANPTTIDAQGQTRGVLVTTTSGVGGTALDISGFTITNGFATGVAISPDPLQQISGFGGGLSADQSFLAVTNCVFLNNVAAGKTGSDFGGAGAGGGMSLRAMAGTVRVSGVTFTGNQALGGVGANRGGYGQGGGLFSTGTAFVGQDLEFTQNFAGGGTTTGSGMSADGQLGDGQGGGAVLSFGTAATLTRVNVSGNVAQGGNVPNGRGGGAFGGGLFSEQLGTLTVTASQIRGNKALGGTGGAVPNDLGAGVTYGGGIHAFEGGLVLDRVTVIDNQSLGGAGAGAVGNGPPQGGGVAMSGAKSGLRGTFTNTVIAGNVAGQQGTGSINRGGGGGGVTIQGPQATFTQVTLADNSLNTASLFGAGVLVFTYPGGTETPGVTLNFTAVTGNNGQGKFNPAAVHAFAGTTVAETRVLYFNNSDNDNSDNVPASPGAPGAFVFNTPPITGNPNYVSPGGPAFDYHIQAGSAAQNAATGSTTPVDITNTQRVGVPDIGAFEVQSLGIPAPAGGNVLQPVAPPNQSGGGGGGNTSGAVAVGLSTGTARMLSANGSVAFTVNPFAGFGGEVRVASADLNGDGVLDLVAGTGPGVATQVVVINGVNQQPIITNSPFESTFTGGVFVSTGDITGDGVADVIVSPDQAGGPRVIVIDGQTQQVFLSFFGIDDPNFRGGARTATGDLNGDGIPELIVAAGFGGGPRVTVFDGAQLRNKNIVAVANFFIFEETLRNGSYVATGDLNADGVADLIGGGGPGGAPRVYALDGPQVYQNSTNPTVLANFFAGDVNARGGVRVAGKKLTSQSFADIVTGSGDIPRAIAYSGSTGNTGTPPVLFDYNDPAGGAAGVYVG